MPVMATFALMIYGIVAAGPWFTVLTARAMGARGAGPAPCSPVAGWRTTPQPGSAR